VDLDQDGNLDLVSGSYSRMEGSMAGTFQVLFGKPDKKFKKAETLNGSDGKPLVIPANDDDEMTRKICTRQSVVDWDGDGKLDIVTGNFEGGFYWFPGEGKGKFNPKPQRIDQGGKPLKLPPNGHHSDPFIVDWDGDGDHDLLTGSTDAGVYLAENTAGKGKPPVLNAFKAVIFPAGKEWERGSGKVLREADLKRPTYGCRIWVEDVNGDGKLDVLVGDNTTLSFPKAGVSEAEMQKKLGEWEKENSAVMAKYQEATKDIKDFKNLKPDQRERITKVSKEMSKLRQRRSEFMTEEMTGFVWLYLQK
jgi:hypothetical protein